MNIKDLNVGDHIRFSSFYYHNADMSGGPVTGTAVITHVFDADERVVAATHGHPAFEDATHPIFDAEEIVQILN